MVRYGSFIISIFIFAFFTYGNFQFNKIAIIETTQIMNNDIDTIPPPKPEKLQSEIDLEIEIDSLNKQREKNLIEFVKLIKRKCVPDSTNKRFIMQLLINPSGYVEKFNFSGLDQELQIPSSLKVIDCASQMLKDNELNFGEIKIKRSARQTHPRTINYTLPIK